MAYPRILSSLGFFFKALPRSSNILHFYINAQRPGTTLLVPFTDRKQLSMISEHRTRYSSRRHHLCNPKKNFGIYNSTHHTVAPFSLGV